MRLPNDVLRVIRQEKPFFHELLRDTRHFRNEARVRAISFFEGRSRILRSQTLGACRCKRNVAALKAAARPLIEAARLNVPSKVTPQRHAMLDGAWR